MGLNNYYQLFLSGRKLWLSEGDEVFQTKITS